MITVRHGANVTTVDAAGRTIREIRDIVRDELNLPDGNLESRLSFGLGMPQQVVAADQVVQDNATLEYVKAQGEKGGCARHTVTLALVETCTQHRLAA